MSESLGEYALSSPLIRRQGKSWQRWREDFAWGNGKRVLASVVSIACPLIGEEWAETIHVAAKKGVFFDGRWHLVLKGKGSVVNQVKQVKEIQ